jgi:hypothetical protein
MPERLDAHQALDIFDVLFQIFRLDHSMPPKIHKPTAAPSILRSEQLKRQAQFPEQPVFDSFFYLFSRQCLDN